jgi:hypothetical protein
MQATSLSKRTHSGAMARIGKRLAIVLCFVGSLIGLAAIIGLVVIFKPELPF